MIPLNSESEPSTLVDLGSGVFAEITRRHPTLIKRSNELEDLQSKLLNEEQLTHLITTNSEEFEKLASILLSTRTKPIC